ncbi:MAG: hypothetical protein ACREBW_04180 [Candidatus Micrarchaeaceae archaeon]
MTTTLATPQELEDAVAGSSIPETINNLIADLMASLPDPKLLTHAERRGIVARYTSVLEGNFIYWMTATLIAAKSEEAHPILLENLHEEVKDAHPVMLRKFSVAANSYPDAGDALVVDEDLTRMRWFLGRLSGVQSLLTMAFFEGFIQKFMAYLAELAAGLGSTEMEYTDVHGVCDVAHTAGLIRAFEIESANHPLDPDKNVFEGVYLLRTLLNTIVFGKSASMAAAA